MAGRYLEIQEQINQLSQTVISEEDMATIHPVMPGQSELPGVEGRTSAQIFNDSDRTDLNPQSIIEDYTYNYDDLAYTQGYDPDNVPVSSCNPLNCHIMTPFETFSQLLKTTPNPISDEVIETLKSVSATNLMDKEKLLTQYILLAKICGGDWGILKDTIIDAALKNYNALLSCIEGMLKVYQIQHSRIVNNSLLSLGNATDEIKVATKMLSDQTRMDQTFNKDLTQQLNHFTASIAQFMEIIESKTLELHHPTRRVTKQSPITPTADSVSSPQINLPGVIEDHPCTTYRNDLISVTFDHNLNVMASVKTAAAQPLAVICALPLKPKIICGILNKDLCLVMKAMSQSTEFARRFHETEDKEIKSRLLKDTFGKIPFKDGQWFRD